MAFQRFPQILIASALVFGWISAQASAADASADGGDVAKAEEALRSAIRGLGGKAKKVAAIKLGRAIESARQLGPPGVSASLLSEAEAALQGASATEEKLRSLRAALATAAEQGIEEGLRDALRSAAEAGLTKGPEVAEAERVLAPFEKARKQAKTRERKRRKALQELRDLLTPEAKARAAAAPHDAATALREALAAARRILAKEGLPTSSTDDIESNGQTETELLQAGDARLEELAFDALPREERLDRASASFGDESCRPPTEPSAPAMCLRLGAESLVQRSQVIGEANCDHPTLRDDGAAEAAPLPNALPRETSKNFCRYPPRFNLKPAEDGKGFHPVAFEFPPKLFNLTELESEGMSDLAVVNLDLGLFRSSIAACGGSEVWLVEFYVHWCPHCMQMMPEFYKLGMALRAAGAKLRVGAVNCATQKDLCGAFQVIGHPMIAFFYGGVGPNGQVNLFEYRGRDMRVNAILDAMKQNRNPAWDAGAPADFEIPKHLYPAEAAVDLVGMLPEEYKPGEAVMRWLANSSRTRSSTCPERRKWHDADASDIIATDDGGAATEQAAGAVSDSASRRKRGSFIGNGWLAWEHAVAAAKHRVQEAAQALVYTLEEWVVPNPAGPSPHAFAYAELRDLSDWVSILLSSFPTAQDGGPDLSAAIAELKERLVQRLLEIEAADGRGALCVEEWRRLVLPLRRAFDQARAGRTLVPLCRTETCRVWSLLHVISISRLARASSGAAEELEHGNSVDTNAWQLNRTATFLRRYFTCRSCRIHFLEQWEAGAHGLAAARSGGPRENALWWWRLHMAVSVRVASEGKCKADRRWPPADVCTACWPATGTGASAALTSGDDEAVLRHLLLQYWPAQDASEASTHGAAEGTTSFELAASESGAAHADGANLTAASASGSDGVDDAAKASVAA